MIVDALILAGGRSSRLGGSTKRELRVGGTSLLETTVSAVRAVGARHIVIVGEGSAEGAVAVQETPRFAGPVAAIAAGLVQDADEADAVLVLACDMPGIGRALPTLLDAVTGDGAIAVDRGRRQQLALAVAPTALTRALEALPTVVDAAVRDLLAQLELADVDVPDGATDDIDTWEDAARLGAVPPTPTGSPS